jgi:hypothetical protein
MAMLKYQRVTSLQLGGQIGSPILSEDGTTVAGLVTVCLLCNSFGHCVSDPKHRMRCVDHYQHEKSITQRKNEAFLL